jgi:hypothetical protein
MRWSWALARVFSTVRARLIRDSPRRTAVGRRYRRDARSRNSDSFMTPKSSATSCVMNRLTPDLAVRCSNEYGPVHVVNALVAQRPSESLNDAFELGRVLLERRDQARRNDPGANHGIELSLLWEIRRRASLSAALEPPLRAEGGAPERRTDAQRRQVLRGTG